MGCVDWAERISAYVDDELALAERGEVEKHIASCAECARAAEGQKKVSSILRALPRVGAPAGLRDAVRAAIAPASRGKVIPFLVRHRAWVQTAAAAVAMLLLAYAFYSPAGRRARSLAPQGGEKFAREDGPRMGAVAEAPARKEDMERRHIAVIDELAKAPAGRASGPSRPAAPDSGFKEADEELAGVSEDAKTRDKALKEKMEAPPVPPGAPPQAGGAPAPAAAPRTEEKESQKKWAGDRDTERGRSCQVEMLCSTDPADARKKVTRLLRDLRVKYDSGKDANGPIRVAIPADRAAEVVEALNRLEPSRYEWRALARKGGAVAGKQAGGAARGGRVADEQKDAEGQGAGFAAQAQQPPASASPLQPAEPGAREAKATARGLLNVTLLLEQEQAVTFGLKKKNQPAGAAGEGGQEPLTLIISVEPEPRSLRLEDEHK